MTQRDALKQSHGQQLKQKIPLLAASRDSLAEQGAAEEMLHRVSPMLEKKVLLLQWQLQHKVWSDYEGLLHP